MSHNMCILCTHLSFGTFSEAKPRLLSIFTMASYSLIKIVHQNCNVFVVNFTPSQDQCFKEEGVSLSPCMHHVISSHERFHPCISLVVNPYFSNTFHHNISLNFIHLHHTVSFIPIPCNLFISLFLLNPPPTIIHTTKLYSTPILSLSSHHPHSLINLTSTFSPYLHLSTPPTRFTVNFPAVPL